MDDDTATALGVRLGLRLGLVALGVLVSRRRARPAAADFVAPLAPQIARRTTRTAQIPLSSSALPGAVIVVGGDLLARRLFCADRTARGGPHGGGRRPVSDLADHPRSPRPQWRHRMSPTTSDAAAGPASATATAPGAGEGRLAARALTLAYEDRTVVRELDLTVPDGQVTVIVGPNACGKSTTLRRSAGC
ncbi:hypothetical protein SCALM49S_06160 [Streptomyces californicus]